MSAFRRLASAGDLEDRRADLANTDLLALRLDRVPHGPLLRRCWELRPNLTVYDAVCIALAEALDVTLLTVDRDLANAPGSRCGVEVLTH